jgi:hypothetical protein
MREIRDAPGRYGLLWPVPIFWDRAGISMLASILSEVQAFACFPAYTLSMRVVGQHEWPIVMRDRASRAMPMPPCHTDRHGKHGVSGNPTKGAFVQR